MSNLSNYSFITACLSNNHRRWPQTLNYDRLKLVKESLTHRGKFHLVISLSLSLDSFSPGFLWFLWFQPCDSRRRDSAPRAAEIYSTATGCYRSRGTKFPRRVVESILLLITGRRGLFVATSRSRFVNYFACAR